VFCLTKMDGAGAALPRWKRERRGRRLISGTILEMVLKSVNDKRWEVVMIVSFNYPYTFVPDQDSVCQSTPSKAYTPEYKQVSRKGCRYLTTVDATFSPESHRSLLPWLDSKVDPSLERYLT
jgi:hypothetical protein